MRQTYLSKPVKLAYVLHGIVDLMARVGQDYNVWVYFVNKLTAQTSFTCAVA